ncbi:MAG: T9SS type A sorting domain-containing protein [Fimbriimonadaceae bacterium]|nr:T9SS type A sorting domain-containing protein [Chitinophagales bacterium]
MKNFYSIIISLFIYQMIFLYCRQASAQTAPEIEWQKSLGGTNSEMAFAVTLTGDGGFVICGETYSNNADVSGLHSFGYSDGWVVKIDSMGNIEWQHAIGGTNNDWFYDIKTTPDNGFIVVGFTKSNDGDISGNHGGQDVLAVKLDSTGNIVWQKCYGGTLDDVATSVLLTSEEGFVFTGYARSEDGDVISTAPFTNFWTVKLNSDGEIVWQTTNGTTLDDEAQSIAHSADNGYIAIGQRQSGDWYTAYITQLDSSGNVVWEGDIDNNDFAFDLVAADTGFVITGSNEPPSSMGEQFTVILINSIGEEGAVYEYGGNSYHDERGMAIISCPDGNYISAGFTGSDDGDISFNFGNGDAWIINTNAEGTLLWEKTYGGSESEVINDIQLISEGNYIAVGYSDSNDGDVSGNHGHRDIWVLRLSEDAPCIPNTFYADVDEDGYGDPLSNTLVCEAPEGYVINILDCDDTNHLINPEGFESCNDIDDDCNGLIDDTPPLHAAFFVYGFSNVCKPGYIVLTVIGWTDGYTYTWKRNGEYIPGASGSAGVYLHKKTGYYQLEVTNGTCSDLSDSIFVRSLSRPEIFINVVTDPDICETGLAILHATSGIGYSYQWLLNGDEIEGATEQNITATEVGRYKVFVVDTFGCENKSNAKNIFSSCRFAEDNLNAAQIFTIYPNPNSGEFTLHISELIDEEIIFISIKNMLGSAIYSEQINSSELNHQINLDKNIAEGIYVVEVSTADKIFAQQIIISK